MSVVADSHALVWYAQGSSRLSARAGQALREAEESDGIVVSVATLIDLWYVTQTTRAIGADLLDELEQLVRDSDGIELHAVDGAVADQYRAIDRAVMKDPWDRLITSTAMALELSLVTKDGVITESGLVDTIS